MRFMLDTSVLINLSSDEQALQVLVDAVDVEYLVTHVQTIDEDVRGDVAAVLERLPALEVPTSGFVLGVSRLDMARFADEEPLDDLRSTPEGRRVDGDTRDALIANTALYEAAVLVTDDGRARRRALRVADLEVLSLSGLVERLREPSEGQTERRD